jgi:16S rRNA (cytosine967-C5)-methyltransferase
MLDHLWELLAPNGQMVYVTCSILAQENDEPVRDLCARHPDAQLQKLKLTGATKTDCGIQFLPGTAQDGLYYASIRKV